MDHVQFENITLAQSLIRKLLYFDIFSHPLLAKEMMEFCDFQNVAVDEFNIVLDELKSKQLINYESGFYFIGNDTSKIKVRLEGNKLAAQRMKDAKRFAKIIANFPFVRALFISGSLSKHVMKPESDIDFFLITEPGKLWLCRGLLTIFKKLFLWDSHRNFCLNYFIDSNNLEIPDKNVFTATEIAFLLPIYNYPLYKNFMSRNIWYHQEFPNIKIRSEEILIKPFRSKNILEFLLNNMLGKILDQLCFSIILGYWKKKFQHLSMESFSLNLRSKKSVSKHHPQAFQERVLIQYSKKIQFFEQTTGFSLTPKIEQNIVVS